MQNFINLSPAVHELSCAQRKKTRTNTIQSFATARTVKIKQDFALRQRVAGDPPLLFQDRHAHCRFSSVGHVTLAGGHRP